MSIAFRFGARAWSEPRARWTLATIAPLLDAPVREVAPGANADGATVTVFVGDTGNAPPDAAVVIPVGQWPIWSAATLERVQWNGAALAVPGGRLDTPALPHELPAQWLPALWYALSREEERGDPRRDQWGCFSGAFARSAAIGLLETPWVDAAARGLRERLDQWCARRGVVLARVPRWKNGAPFAVALSHDVDDVRLRSVRQSLRLLALARSPGSYAFRAGVVGLARVIAPRAGEVAPAEPRGRPGDPYAQFERWAAEEDRRGFRSTFFVVARPRRPHENDPLYALDDRVPFEGATPTVGGMFRRLAARGFEIGVHGSYESWRNGERLAAERAAVTAATGSAALASRQHFLRLDLDRTWDAQERAGFTTDATLGYNEAIGFRAGIAAPFHPWDANRRAARALLEVPLTLMDGALFRGLGLTPERARERTLAHLDAVEAVGGMAGLLWHPNVAAEALYPGWWDCFIAALDRCAARGAWVASVGEIGDWWRERSRRLAAKEA